MLSLYVKRTCSILKSALLANQHMFVKNTHSNRGSVASKRGGLGSEMGGSFKREGIYVYLWLIHVDILQKPTQSCKRIILQLKNELIKKKR